MQMQAPTKHDPVRALTYRDWSQVSIQHIEVSISHGGPDGEGADTLIVAPIGQPVADTNGGFCGAVEVEDLGVGQQHTCALCQAPAHHKPTYKDVPTMKCTVNNFGNVTNQGI